MILTMRTDSPQAEIGLYKAGQRIAYIKWQADRNLAADIHKKLSVLFKRGSIKFENLTGIIFYKGPGSFTGLRIGTSVSNTLASELNVPIIGANGEEWINSGISLLGSSPERKLVQIEYGSAPKTTKPKK